MKYITYIATVILFTVFILNFSLIDKSIKAENYTVIKVDGKITIIESGKDLSTGVLFFKNDKLSFATPESRAAVISSVGGRFVLVPNAKSGKASNLLPAMSNVATRAGSLLNTLNIINYFGEDFLLLDSLDINISSKEFVMDNQNFFYLKYIYNEDTIAKKLKYNDNTLILSAKDIYTIDGNEMIIPEEGKVSLYYTRGSTNKGVFLTSFNLITPKKETLVSELTIINKALNKKSNEDKVDEFHAYLNEFYGNVQRKNIANWVKQNLEI